VEVYVIGDSRHGAPLPVDRVLHVAVECGDGFREGFGHRGLFVRVCLQVEERLRIEASGSSLRNGNIGRMISCAEDC